ncbi:hypothetical protein BH23BAC2_BH23BAC2_24140 [soil metagenome]
MIFNTIKLSAARKRVAQLVGEQKIRSFPGTPKTMSIVIDAKNEIYLPVLLKLKKELKIAPKDFTILYYSTSKTQPDCCEASVFNLQDFSAKGEILNEGLAEKSSQGVDLLITFAAENNTTAHLITAHFKAGLKVGRYQQNLALYDLILQTEEDADLFVEELLKYLKHLTKSSNE